MRRTLSLACATLAAVMLPATATAGELVLTDAPGSNWVVDNGEDSCRLVRTLGEGEDQVMLLIAQWAPGNDFSVTLTGQPLRRFNRDRLRLAFADPAGPLGWRTETFRRGRLGEHADAFFINHATLLRPDEDTEPVQPADANEAPMLGPAAIAQANRIDLAQGDNSLLLRPTRLADALGVLDACSQTRLPEWGLDTAAHRTMIRRARPIDERNFAARFLRRYPDIAFAANLHLRVLVDEAGSVTSCTLIAATATDMIREPACDFLTDKTLFHPALDAAGRPMKSFWTTSVTGRATS